MRNFAIILLAATSFGAIAAEDPNSSCPLLVREDLAGLGVTQDTAFVDSDWKWDETPKEVPGAKVASNLCTVNLASPGGRTAVMLAVDRFEGKATEEQVKNWIAATAEARDKEEGVTLVKVEDITCETGNYELPTTNKEGTTENVNEIYVACNAQAGTRHISLNVHVPEADKATLPSPAQTKAMLDKSLQRLKELALGPKV